MSCQLNHVNVLIFSKVDNAIFFYYVVVIIKSIITFNCDLSWEFFKKKEGEAFLSTINMYNAGFMKVLLIQPPVEDFYDTDIRLQPLGLCYLKAAAKYFLSPVKL